MSENYEDNQEEQNSDLQVVLDDDYDGDTDSTLVGKQDEQENQNDQQDDVENSSPDVEERPKKTRQYRKVDPRIINLKKENEKLRKQQDEISRGYVQKLKEERGRNLNLSEEFLKTQKEDLENRIGLAEKNEDSVVSIVRLTNDLSEVNNKIQQIKSVSLKDDEGIGKFTQPVKEEKTALSQEELIEKLPEQGQNWVENNPEFFNDQNFQKRTVLTGEILETEGFDPYSSEYWDELNERMSSKVPETKKSKVNTKNAPVGNSSRSGRTVKNEKTVKLSKEEINAADEWGISKEAWAKRKLELEKNTTNRNMEDIGWVPIKVGNI